MSEDHSDLITPRPHHVVARLHFLETRAWTLGVVAAGGGITLTSLTWSDVGRHAMFTAGIGCCVGALILMVGAVVLAHQRVIITLMTANKAQYEERFDLIAAIERRTLSSIGSVLGAAENELQRRREQR